MKSKLLVIFLMLALSSWAQTSTPTAPDKPGDTAAKCACCEKMTVSAADHKTCCHAQKEKTANAAACCGKGSKSCCGDSAKCVGVDAGSGATTSCCSGKGQCGASKKGCCGEAVQTSKMACCGKQCGMKSAGSTELPN